jgi:hypothetical protein
MTTKRLGEQWKLWPEKNGRKILEKAGNDLALFFGPRYSRIRGD